MHYVLAFDTANEVIALGLGTLDVASRSIACVASRHIDAHRASNTRLIPEIDELLKTEGVSRKEISCIVCGRGPGSFTGVRIAMASAKGIASALRCPLIGVSSTDSVAWNAWATGVRGRGLVVADAMRHEVYPVIYELTQAGALRQSADRVVKVELAADEFGPAIAMPITFVAGDALSKYADQFEPCAPLLDAHLWTPTGEGLLLAAQYAWRTGEADLLDVVRHNPAFALPVYTRLSDAEENERTRLATTTETKDLVSGVQGENAEIVFKPFDAAYANRAAELEAAVMGTDAWKVSQIVDDLPRKDRTWWMACAPNGSSLELVGYAGGMIIDGDMQILKVACDDAYRRRGIGRELVARIAADARDLGASTCSLEVRASNIGAQDFYQSLGLTSVGTRPRYYSDGESAIIMQGALPIETADVAGMNLRVDHGMVEGLSTADQPTAQTADQQAAAILPESARPLIFAIESSCDETAAAIVCGDGTLVANVVASQIDFHSRFGGVVPEIASRKHIEAMCGVCDECFDVAAESLGVAHLGWSDIDAVSVTYAPGLVGALVVGVAFAKGAAWAANKPFIGVNHLEGHLYANKIDAPDFEPPAVVSLVSGGNTMLVHMKDWASYSVLGMTIDDAVGEAFDKVAKALGLGYPGGPAISRFAAEGNPDAIAFPRAMLHSGDYRFSLSGLKTAVITYINQELDAGRQLNLPDICASFQAAVVDVQVAKAKTALKETGAPRFCLGGGVAANPALRAAYTSMCKDLGVTLSMPPFSACTDNAGMIALVALDRYNRGAFFDLSADAYAHADLECPY